MKINFKTKLTQLNGEAIVVPKADGSEEPMTLSMVAGIALKMMRKDDSGDEKYKDWKLAKKIEDAGEEDISVSTEEASRLKKLIGLHFGPEVVGPTWTLLEGEEL